VGEERRKGGGEGIGEKNGGGIGAWRIKDCGGGGDGRWEG